MVLPFLSEAAIFFCRFSFVVFVLPYLWRVRLTLFLNARVGGLTNAGYRVVSLALGRAIPKENASECGGLGHPLVLYFFVFVFAGGSQGPSDAWRPGRFCWEGARIAQVSFTRTFFFPRFPFVAFGAELATWRA